MILAEKWWNGKIGVGLGRFGKVRSIVRYRGEVYLTFFPSL